MIVPQILTSHVSLLVPSLLVNCNTTPVQLSDTPTHVKEYGTVILLPPDPNKYLPFCLMISCCMSKVIVPIIGLLIGIVKHT